MSEVVPASDTTVVPFGYEDLPNDIKKYVSLASSQRERMDGTPQEISERIAEEILNAETVDDIFANSAIGPSDLAGRKFSVTEVEWQLSDKFADQEESFPVYAVAHVKLADTGESTVVTCGGRNIMAQLYKLQEMGALPSRLLQFVSKSTRRGYETWWLAKGV